MAKKSAKGKTAAAKARSSTKGGKAKKKRGKVGNVDGKRGPRGLVSQAPSMLQTLTGEMAIASKAVDDAFGKAVAATGAKVNREQARRLKAKAVVAYQQAASICRNLTDVNGDGVFDADDIRAAAEKAGLVWGKLDPDMKEALLAGAVAAVALLLVPIVGQALAVPVFAATTAYFYLIAKLKKSKKK